MIPVAGYVMNVCTFTKQKLDELDKAIKKILRDNKMHGRQASDERLYMRRENGGRGLKNMKDLYQETFCVHLRLFLRKLKLRMPS